MLVYPQLGDGSLAQFPIIKRNRQRTVVNALRDSTEIKFGDPYGQMTEWELKYVNLSDNEIIALQQFFTAAEGSLNVFTFLDPTANLLSWTNQLTNVVWVKDPFLSLTPGLADPIGGSDACQVGNSGSGPQRITQTLSAPGAYQYCFSTYGRSDQAATITLLCGNARLACVLESSWARLSLTASGDPTAESMNFGLELPADATINVFGFQVEPQPSPSVYKPTRIGGVYENASFRDDVFSFTTTDVNHHSTIVTIVHANSI